MSSTCGTHLVTRLWQQESQLMQPRIQLANGLWVHVAGSSPVFPNLVLPGQASCSLWAVWKREPLQVLSVLLFWGEPSTLVPKFNYVPYSCLGVLSLCTTCFFHRKPGCVMSTRTWTLRQCDGMPHQTPGCSFGISFSELFYKFQTLWSRSDNQISQAKNEECFRPFFLMPLPLNLYFDLV